MNRTDPESSAGVGEDGNRGGGPVRGRRPQLKLPAKTRTNHQEQDQQDSKKEEQLEELQLEEVGTRLILREEQLFRQDSPIMEAEEDLLLRDLEDFRLRIWTAVHNTFTLSSSAEQQELLRSAVASIQRQEEQDRRWDQHHEGRVPSWRPQNCLSTHNTLLDNMVEFRLTEASKDQTVGEELSSDIKRQVCRWGRRVKEDLLTVARTVAQCYPADMDVLNLYVRLYHRRFSARLTHLLLCQPNTHDCCYLLLWVNHYYTQDVLRHEDLDGQIQVACLGPLLPQVHLDQLEDRYVNHTEGRVKLWLTSALSREQQSWQRGSSPELIDGFWFSPLGVEVIQVIDGALAEFKCAVRDQSRFQTVSVHLESFLCRYRVCVEDLVKLNLGFVSSVVKAQLVVEQQLRDFTTGSPSLAEERRRRCVDMLSALRDCGYRYLTCPVHLQLKTCLSPLWTPAWEDGSRPVVDHLLDVVNQHVSHLRDLKPSCRQVILGLLHEDVVVHYVRKTLKSRMKNREQQVGGAQRVVQDAHLMDSFFTEGPSGESWLCVMLCRLADIIRLQDPTCIQQEVVTLSLHFPDFSDAHLSALLSLNISLSAVDVHSIRRSVERLRPPDVSNHSRPFFSRVKVKRSPFQISRMVLRP